MKNHRILKIFACILAVLILFFAAVFFFSGWQLFTILRAYQEGQNSYA